MILPRTAMRALAGICTLSLVLAACGDDDEPSGDSNEDTEQTTEASEETTESTEAEEETTESTEAEEETTESTEAEDPGDPDAVATAEAINIKIEDFAEGWTEEPEAGDGEGGDDFDECFTTVDLAEVTVGEAETPTFSAEAADGQSGQVVAMKTIVFDSPESASAVLTEIATQDFANCTQSGITGSDVEGVQASLTPTADEPPVGEESVGVAGAVQIPGEDGEVQQGAVDFHAIRTGPVASFTMTLDIGETPDTAFEQTLTDLYGLIAQRQAAEVG